MEALSEEIFSFIHLSRKLMNNAVPGI